MPLGLTPTDKANLVAFLKALTDDRVRWGQAPFDHPELHVPNGQTGDQTSVKRKASNLQAADDVIVLTAVGEQGRAAKNLPPLQPFDAGLR